MPDVPWPASRRQIDLAGERLRDWWLDSRLSSDLVHTDPKLSTAANLALDFRAGFQLPVSKTAMGLRSFVSRESSRVIVSQRLKRMPTIMDKLGRYPNMKLSRMEDIGGCRALLPGGASEIHRVVRRIRRNWQVARYRDYIAEPKATGYRAVHLIVNRDGRLIEIQLRSPAQQWWAAEVDRIASQLGAHIKDGDGPEALTRFLKLLADRVALKESSGGAETFPEEAEFQSLWPQVRVFFEER